MVKKYVYEYNLQELYYLKQEPFTITEAVWWLGGIVFLQFEEYASKTLKV